MNAFISKAMSNYSIPLYVGSDIAIQNVELVESRKSELSEEQLSKLQKQYRKLAFALSIRNLEQQGLRIVGRPTLSIVRKVLGLSLKTVQCVGTCGTKKNCFIEWLGFCISIGGTVVEIVVTPFEFCGALIAVPMSFISPSTSLKITRKCAKFDMMMDKFGYEFMGEVDYSFEKAEEELREKILKEPEESKKPKEIDVVVKSKKSKKSKRVKEQKEPTTISDV